MVRRAGARPLNGARLTGAGGDDVKDNSNRQHADGGGSDRQQNFDGGVRAFEVALPSGEFTRRPDVAIVVFGEHAYAESAGDVPTLEYSPGDKHDLALLRRLRAREVPVVALFISGRPLWLNAEINAADSFVAVWLPGLEGGGVADVLFRTAAGAVRYDFRGRLPFSWPASPRPPAVGGRAGEPPLFPLGYGLSYRNHP